VTIAVRGALALTDQQRAAVEWGDGPLMVLAGAGTGKTTVIVERVRYLLDQDPTLKPENVLVLTYNVRAAAELTRRLEEALGQAIDAGARPPDTSRRPPAPARGVTPGSRTSPPRA
jgi:superfamily I DNA/RNA helicase